MTTTSAHGGTVTRLATADTGTTVTGLVFAAIRIAYGWIFLWALLDKTFGLGFNTAAGKAWIDGGHPTAGFLGHAEGPLSAMWHAAAGTWWADGLFMAALAGIGVALLLGIGMRVAAASGAMLYLLMWTVVLPPATNPLIDDHVISGVVLIGLALVKAGDVLGLGRPWSRTRLVRRLPWLR